MIPKATAEDQEALGFRIVIDVIPEGPGMDLDAPDRAGFLALASIIDLPGADARAFDHEDTFAFAAGATAGSAGSAAAAVTAAWLSEASLSTDRLWRIYGDRGDEGPSEARTG